jgi:hypothetical protein
MSASANRRREHRVKPRAGVWRNGYTCCVSLVVLGVLVLVVAFVAIDGIARLDEPRARRPRLPRVEADITTQKIIVDLTRRR